MSLPNTPVIEPAAGLAAINAAEAAPVEVPTLFVFLDVANGLLHFKPGIKGARFRNSQTTSMEEVCDEADTILGERYNIEFVDAPDA